MMESVKNQYPDVKHVYTIEEDENDDIFLFDRKRSVKNNKFSDIEIIHIIEEDEKADDFLAFSTKKGGEKHNPISVEAYSDSMNLQKALLQSLRQTQKPVSNLSDDIDLQKALLQSQLQTQKCIINLSDDEVYEELALLEITKSTHRNQTPFSRPSITETGQSSNSKLGPPPAFCKICMEPINPDDIFTVNDCRHVFCSNCIGLHIAAKIQENAASVKCPEPGCEGVLEPAFCQTILPPDVFDRWGSVLCESLIIGSMKFYCPFKDCSALLVDERENVGGECVIMESECPHCRRLFCAQCKVPWHSEITCSDFQKLRTDEREAEDIKLMNLAKKEKWQRCPKCGVYVERIDGCLYMLCRCQHSFCYHCAGPVGNTHYCPKCMR